MNYQLGQMINLSPIRKTIAMRLRDSVDTAVQANHRIRADMGAVLAARTLFKTAGKEVTVGDILLFCVARAIAAQPLINSTLDGNHIVIHEDVNLGVAVATEWGLMVPVIHKAHVKTLDEIASEVKQLSERARTRRLSMEEMAGGTFTVTNLGMLGIESFTAVINPPEAAILAVGACVDTVVPSAEGLIVRPLCELSLTYDHRILDGEPAARFLMAVKKEIEAFSTPA